RRRQTHDCRIGIGAISTRIFLREECITADKEQLDIADIDRRMKGAVAVLKQEFAGLLTGRAHASLLDPITVNAYGAQVPLNQVGTVSVPEPRMISVQVGDKRLVSACER